jgi:carbon storage regulator CsrA
MLVLTRKLQQQIKIGEQITVTILRVKGNTVRVGIQAPRQVRVVRGELPKDADGQEAVTPQDEQPAEATLLIDTQPEAPAEITSVACGAVVESDELPGAAGRTACSAEAGETAVPVSAAHLPLRRIRNRHGVGPLKQAIASCATLAK